MWHIDTIREMNAEAGERARANRTRPIAVRSPEDVYAPGFQIPMLGTAADDFDEDYEFIERLFVDISGWGSDDEPALSQDQLIAKLSEMVEEHGTLYVGLDSHAQFQGYVSVWKDKA